MLFYDEIHPDEIPSLYAQCSIGLVALDERHKSHNIPGKFLTYMQNGLPVLACVNSGNDLADVIRSEEVGCVCENHEVDNLVALGHRLLNQIETDKTLSLRCKSLFERQFSVKQAVSQIVATFTV